MLYNEKSQTSEAAFATSLPANSKIWVYQSSRKFSDSETQKLKNILQQFVQEWTSHSKKVVAEAEVFYNRFIILTADEAACHVGGCSIDSSVRFLREVEQEFNTRLFDRHTIAYQENGEINTAEPSVFTEMISQGKVNDQTIVFNNLVSTLEEWREKWQTSFGKSWHSKYFQNV